MGKCQARGRGAGGGGVIADVCFRVRYGPTKGFWWVIKEGSAELCGAGRGGEAVAAARHTDHAAGKSLGKLDRDRALKH